MECDILWSVNRFPSLSCKKGVQLNNLQPQLDETVHVNILTGGLRLVLAEVPDKVQVRFWPTVKHFRRGKLCFGSESLP